MVYTLFSDSILFYLCYSIHDGHMIAVVLFVCAFISFSDLPMMQANLVCPLVESRAVKLQMLCTRSTMERMRLNKAVLEQLQDSQINGCSVM